MYHYMLTDHAELLRECVDAVLQNHIDFMEEYTNTISTWNSSYIECLKDMADTLYYTDGNLV